MIRNFMIPKPQDTTFRHFQAGFVPQIFGRFVYVRFVFIEQRGANDRLRIHVDAQPQFSSTCS